MTNPRDGRERRACTPRSVALFGKGELAIRIAKWFHESPEYRLQYVVPVIPEPTWTDSLSEWCAANQIAIVPTGCYRDIPCVDSENWSVDLGFSVFYDKIFPAWFITKVGCFLNLHNGPLPRYRGMSPVNWALRNGERKHGVTIHRITPEIDAGPIISQVEYSIYPETDEVVDVYRRALRYGYTLFEQTLPILDRIPPQSQDESQATYYSKEDDGLLGDRRNFTRALSTQGQA